MCADLSEQIQNFQVVLSTILHGWTSAAITTRVALGDFLNCQVLYVWEWNQYDFPRIVWKAIAWKAIKIWWIGGI